MPVGFVEVAGLAVIGSVLGDHQALLDEHARYVVLGVVFLGSGLHGLGYNEPTTASEPEQTAHSPRQYPRCLLQNTLFQGGIYLAGARRKLDDLYPAPDTILRLPHGGQLVHAPQDLRPGSYPLAPLNLLLGVDELAANDLV